MLCLMNDAARSCRAIDAPMLNDFGPHNAGMGPMPAPLFPWQRAQLSVNSLIPRDESPTSFGSCAMDSPRTCEPVGTPREMNAKYATISCISRLSGGSLDPAKLRVKQ